MISMVRIGVNSMIGSFAIPGPPTIIDNACRVFHANSVISDPGSFPEAARFARNFTAVLPENLTSRMVHHLSSIHEQICEEVRNVPISLSASFESFQAQPSKLGIARYFNFLADLLDDAQRSRSKSKSS